MARMHLLKYGDQNNHYKCQIRLYNVYIYNSTNEYLNLNVSKIILIKSTKLCIISKNIYYNFILEMLELVLCAHLFNGYRALIAACAMCTFSNLVYNAIHLFFGANMI